MTGEPERRRTALMAPVEVRVPGDKSLTHRALFLAALAEGECRLSGLLPSEDPRSTAAALRALGVPVPELPPRGEPIAVRGVGLRGFRDPDEPLDLGNSGTTARLLLGILAGQELEATLTGDASLRSRPMGRVTDPLATMGARFRWLADPGRLPVSVRGGALGSLDYRLPVASAQVKSALLLAGLVGGVPVRLQEPGPSRDHTERMLEHLGVPLLRSGRAGARGPGSPLKDLPPGTAARSVALENPPPALPPFRFHVPGDFSSAAFLVALALLGGVPGGGLRAVDVGLNPTRTGLLPVLRRMGGRVRVHESGGEGGRADTGGEPRGTVEALPSALRATAVSKSEMPTVIDEIPILAVLAARGEGTTRIDSAGELRVKETDRIRALAVNLRAVGVQVEELPDGLVVHGTDGELAGTVDPFGDHRIAMAFGVLGATPGCRIEVIEKGVVDVSYPGFWDLLEDVRRGAPR